MQISECHKALVSFLSCFVLLQKFLEGGTNWIHVSLSAELGILMTYSFFCSFSNIICINSLNYIEVFWNSFVIDKSFNL